MLTYIPHHGNLHPQHYNPTPPALHHRPPCCTKLYTQTTDSTPRVIFWAHYVDWIVTGPLLIACLAMVSKSDLVSLVFMMVP